MQALAEAAVAKWPVTPFRVELSAHRENAVFRVDAEQGVYALRLHRRDYRTDVELQSEMQFMAALAENGIAVPRPLQSRTSNIVENIKGKQASMLTWLSGQPLGKTGVALNIPDRSETFGRLGKLIAQMHNASDKWRRPSTFQRQSWNIDGLFGESPQWGRFWDNPRLTSQQHETLTAVRNRLRRDLSSEPFDTGLIHADLVSENILFDRSELRIIDFDDSGYGFRLQDLATALVKHEAEPDFESLKQALVMGYQTLRPLDVVNIDLFLFIRHLTYVGWVVPRMTDDDGIARCDRFIANAISKSEAYLSTKS